MQGQECPKPRGSPPFCLHVVGWGQAPFSQPPGGGQGRGGEGRYFSCGVLRAWEGFSFRCDPNKTCKTRVGIQAKLHSPPRPSHMAGRRATLLPPGGAWLLLLPFMGLLGWLWLIVAASLPSSANLAAAGQTRRVGADSGSMASHAGLTGRPQSDCPGMAWLRCLPGEPQPKAIFDALLFDGLFGAIFVWGFCLHCLVKLSPLLTDHP